MAALSLLGALTFSTHAATVAFSWTQNTEPDLGGYNLYYGPTSGNYTNHVVLGKVVTYTMANLVNGANYYFALSAFNTNNIESAVSAELHFPNPPGLAAITNRTTTEDTAIDIALYLTDIDTFSSNLTLTATSTNLTLVPVANITFSGTGTNRNMHVVPAANSAGTSSITVTVSDGALTASRSFLLTVTAVNDPPTISAIADVTTSEDVYTAAIPFTVADTETAASSLTVQAASSNPTLVPTNRIVLGGSGGARTVVLQPVTNQNGSATITITVSDGSQTASRSFLLTVTAVNDAPSISAIADVTTSENVYTAAIAFTLSDPDTAVTSLTVQAASSNPTLIPTNRIVVGGSGASRTVQLQPATNQNGSATITLTVSDGALTGTRSFVLTVTAVNNAPSISTIADVITDEDVFTPAISFTISDPDTAATNLTLSAASSNPTLIPANRIIFGGSGTARTVVLRPATNQNGSATITITVSDGALTASTAFSFTVRTVNDPPTISQITDRNLNEDIQTQAIPFTVDDIDTPIAQLVVTAASANQNIVPDANITLGGSGTNRTVVVRPATNAVGSTVITFTVSDGQASSSKTTTFTFAAVNDPPYVSKPADLTVNKGNPVPPIPFTVWDVETAASALTITLSSSNTTLLPTNRIALSGASSNRTLTLTPIGGQFGTTRIGISVSDGTTNTQVFFLFTCTGSNNSPVLTVPGPFAGNAGAAINIGGIAVTDVDAGTNNLNLTITAPNGTIAVSTTVTNGVKASQISGNNSGSVTIVAPLAALNATLTNANRLVYTSRSDFGGTETIVVTANDNGFSGLGGAKTDTKNILVAVAGSSSLDRWRATYFTSTDLQDPTKEATLWGDLADPDNDSRNNLMEFALGLNPLGSESQDAALVSGTANSGGNQYLTLTFNSRINEPLLQYIPEVSADNATWSATAQRISTTPVNADFERVTWQDTVPITPQAARFMRLRVVKNGP